MKIYLDAADLGRIRFAEAPAPVLEVAMMLFELSRRRGCDPQPSWRGDVLRAFPADARPLGDLFRSTRAVYFLDVLALDVRQGFDAVRETPTADIARDANFVWPQRSRMPAWVRELAAGETNPRQVVDRAVRAFHASCVAPRWGYATTRFEADVASRMDIVRRCGVAGLLNSLSDDMRLDGHVLEVPSRLDQEIHANGKGLVLVPSAFWNGPPLVTRDQQEPSQCVIVYPVRSQDVEPHRMGDALAALLGPTRARVLRALSQPRTTTGIARHAGISVPSASQHAAALRDSGLITSHRRGKIVEHHITSLGLSLLRSNPQESTVHRIMWRHTESGSVQGSTSGPA